MNLIARSWIFTEVGIWTVRRVF